MSSNNRNQRRSRVINGDQVFIVEDNQRRRGNNVAGARDINADIMKTETITMLMEHKTTVIGVKIVEWL